MRNAKTLPHSGLCESLPPTEPTWSVVLMHRYNDTRLFS